MTVVPVNSDDYVDASFRKRTGDAAHAQRDEWRPAPRSCAARKVETGIARQTVESVVAARETV